MTKNQIEYAKLLETRRSNIAQEDLTKSRDAEGARHNLVTEGISRASLDETSRANKAREQETRRANLASETLTAARDAETARANLEREKENFRSHAAQERIQLTTLEETRRANLAKEQEAKRSNQAKEQLTARELNIKDATLSETIRSNQAREVELNRSNVARELEANRSNVAREAETKRHNIADEVTNAARAATYAVDVGGRLIYYNKDFSTNVALAPVNTTTVGNQGSENGSQNDGGGKNFNPNSPHQPGGGNTNNTMTGGNSNGTGKTFWDVASQIQEKPRTTFSQGGSYGGSSSRSQRLSR